MTKARTVRVRDIVGNYEVRQLCGKWLTEFRTGRGWDIPGPVPATGRERGMISRHTLIEWRKQGFPKPIRRLRGSGPVGVELWDASEVRDWLTARAIPDQR